MQRKSIAHLVVLTGCLLTGPAFAQPGGGPEAPEMKIVEEYDADGDGILNAAERAAARTAMEKQGTRGRRRGSRGGQGMAPGKPGPTVAIADAQTFPDQGLYDQTTLRTLFLEFESDDWEAELATFKPTDVEVPAKLTVDGKVFPAVGVSFRGASSFFRIPAGLKRSLNLSIDYQEKDAKLYGYKSLNLLNCNGDASMMSSILYSNVAGKRIAAPKVNYVKVVINGESWGLYVSSQQFNKTFVKEHFAATNNTPKKQKGARWKVSGSPRGDGGLRYLGEDIEPYRERFEIKSKDSDASWKALINLCRVLNETPSDKLQEALEPILDIEGALWFLAVDVAMVNSDGYWTRASDYNIYLDTTGKFHILPHDMNESLIAGQHGGPGGGGGGGRGRPGQAGPGRPEGSGGPPRGGFPGFGPPPNGNGPPPERAGEPGQGGPDRGRAQRGRGNRRGGGGGRGGNSIELDPLVGLDNTRMPLRSVLLNNPSFKSTYLSYVGEIAKAMDWRTIGPEIEQYRELIKAEVALDTRKLFTTKAFLQATDGAASANETSQLRAFLQKRSQFLLNHDSMSDSQ